MSDLKLALKNAKVLLSESKNQEALDCLQEFLNNGDSNYMLFCFGALALFNLKQYEKSRVMYEKALALDCSSPTAWQGLYKLYEADSIEGNQRGVEVCENLLGSCQNEEKRESIMSTLRRIYFVLGNYEPLIENIGTNMDVIVTIIERTSNKLMSTTNKKLLDAAFNVAKDHLDSYPTIRISYFKYLKSTNNPILKEEVLRYCNNITDDEITDETLVDILAGVLCSTYLKTGKTDCTLLKKLCPTNKQSVVAVAVNVLKNIMINSIQEMLAFMRKIPPSSIDGILVPCVAIRLYNTFEYWDKVIELSRKIIESDSEEDLKNIAIWFAIRGFLLSRNNEEALKLYELYQPVLLDEFLTEAVAVMNLEGEKFDAFLSSLNESQSIRARVARAIYLGKSDTVINDVRQLLKREDVLDSDYLLASVTLFEAGKVDSTKEFVEAARRYPFNARIFYMLSMILSQKNVKKALGLAERACQLFPECEDYVKLYESLLERSNFPYETRIKVLSPLVKKNCMWALMRSIGMYYELKDHQSALRCLQMIIRSDKDNLWAWSYLSQVYFATGMYSSSVSAYKECLRIKPGSNFIIPLLQIYIRLEKHADIEELFKTDCKILNAQARTYFELARAEYYFQLSRQERGLPQREHLREVIRILAMLIHEKYAKARAFKLLGDTLMMISKISEKFLPSLEIPVEWNCHDAVGCLKASCSFYYSCLRENDTNSLVYIDLVQGLLLSSSISKSPSYAENAKKIIVLLLKRPLPDRLKSIVWCLLAEAYRLTDEAIDKQIHALIRGLQISKTNAQAWLRLGLVYLQCGEGTLAFKAFETSLKHDPKSAAGWCAWALQAERQNVHDEAYEMYKQSLTWGPLITSVSKYTGYLCEKIRNGFKFDPSIIKIDSAIVESISDFRSVSKENILYAGVLNELFGNYDKAVECFAMVDENGVNHNRAKLKQCNSTPIPCQFELNNLKKLVESDTDQLIYICRESIPIYDKLFNEFENPHVNELSMALVERTIHIPLLISMILYKNWILPNQLVYQMHALRPKHELMDFFPTIVPLDILCENDYLENSGEEPFRSNHFIAKNILEILKIRRENALPAMKATEIIAQEAAESVLVSADVNDD